MHNIYYKQIDIITKSDLINYYKFCERIDDNKNECLSKKEMNSINEIINNIKLEIENKLFILFTSSYSNNIDNIANELKELLINFAERINEILNDKNEKIEEMNLDKFKKLKREYIKNEQNNEEDPEKNENIKKLNNFLSKIAFRNKEIFPFLIKESFQEKSKDLVDILIISFF